MPSVQTSLNNFNELRYLIESNSPYYYVQTNELYAAYIVRDRRDSSNVYYFSQFDVNQTNLARMANEIIDYLNNRYSPPQSQYTEYIVQTNGTYQIHTAPIFRTVPKLYTIHKYYINQPKSLKNADGTLNEESYARYHKQA